MNYNEELSIEVPGHPSFTFSRTSHDREYQLQYNGREPQTLDEAYEISIEKQECMIWGKKVLDTDLCGNYETCGLCLFTFANGKPHDCHGCPVYECTGIQSCEGTPWQAKDWEQELAFIKALRNGEQFDLSEYAVDCDPDEDYYDDDDY